MNIPENITFKDTQEFFPEFTEGRCIKVYDVDSPTLAVIFTGNTKIFRIPLRLVGIDSPEIKSKIKAEKELALTGRKALEDKILGKLVRVELCNKKDKYGRLLCKLFIGEECINDWAIAWGFAQPYGGKTKDAFVFDNDCF